MNLISWMAFLAIAAFVFLIVKAVRRKKKERADNSAALQSRQERPIFYLPAERLMKIQANLDFVQAEEWRAAHPIESFSWDEILGSKKEQLIGVAGQVFSSDVSVLSYATILGCLTERDRKFFNCRAHKEFEKSFVQTERQTIQLIPMYADMFGVSLNEGINPERSNATTPFLMALQRIRSASFQFADTADASTPEDERLMRLANATILIKIITSNSEGRALMFNLIKKMRDAANQQIDQTIYEFQSSLST